MEKSDKVLIFKYKSKKHRLIYRDNSHNFTENIYQKFNIDPEKFSIHGFLDGLNKFIHLEDFIDNFKNFFQNDEFLICLKENQIPSNNDTLKKNYKFSSKIIKKNLNSSQNAPQSNLFKSMKKIENWENFLKYLCNNDIEIPFFIIFLISSKNKMPFRIDNYEFLFKHFNFYYLKNKDCQKFLYDKKITKSPSEELKHSNEFVLIYHQKKLVFIKELIKSDLFLKKLNIEFKNRYENNIGYFFENPENEIIKNKKSNSNDNQEVLFDYLEMIYPKKLFINEYIKIKFVISKNSNIVKKFTPFFGNGNNFQILEKGILKILNVFLQPSDLDEFLSEDDLMDIMDYLNSKKMIKENDYFLILNHFENVFIMQEEKISFLNDIRLSFIKFMNSEILIDNFLESLIFKLEKFDQNKINTIKDILGNLGIKEDDEKKILLSFENKEHDVMEAFDTYFYNKDKKDLIETLKICLEEKENEDNSNIIADDYFLQHSIEQKTLGQKLNNEKILDYKNDLKIRKQKSLTDKKTMSDSEKDDFEKLKNNLENRYEKKSRKKINLYDINDFKLDCFNDSVENKNIFKSLKSQEKEEILLKNFSQKTGLYNTPSIESMEFKTDVFNSNPTSSNNIQNLTMLKMPTIFKKPRSKSPLLKLMQNPSELDNEFSDNSNISQHISNYITSSGSSGLLDQEVFKKKVYTHLLIKIENLLKEISDNINILWSNLYYEDTNFLDKFSLNLKMNKSIILPILFKFKWHPLENQKLVKELHSMINSNKANFSSHEHDSEENIELKYKQREEINLFYECLLDFMSEIKQLLTKKQIKYFKNNLLLADDLFLLSNLEYFLTFNNIEEFIDNLYEYEKINFKINNSTRSIFFNQKTTMEEIVEFFPGLIHSIPSSKLRKKFLDLVRNRDETIIKILFEKPFKRKEIDSYVKKITDYIDLLQKSKYKVNSKKEDNWNFKLLEFIFSIPKNVWSNYAIVYELMESLKNEKFIDNLELKSIYKVFLFNKDKGELKENIEIFCEINNLKKYEEKIIEFHRIFNQFGISKYKGELFIRHFFNNKSKFNEECRDFYNIFLYTNNGENFKNNINVLF